MDAKYCYIGRHDRLGLYTEDNLHTERKTANGAVDIIAWAITILAYIFALFTFPVSLFCCVKIVQEYERAVVFRLGRLQQLKEPGVIFILPCIDKFHRVDMRVKAFNVPPQKILTKDEAAVLIGATIQFLIKDPIASTGTVQDLNHSIRVLAQTTLVNIMMTQKLIEIQNDRKFTSIRAQDELNKATKSWGVQIHRIEISEAQVISPPPEYKPDLTSLFSGDNNPISTIFQAMQGAANGIGPQLMTRQQPPSASLGSTARDHASPPSPLKPAELMTVFNHVTDARLVQDVGSVYQFNITDEGEVWHVDLKSGGGRADRGPPPSGCAPDAVISLSTRDMRALFTGEMSPFDAYMQGRVLVEGDVRIAMKLQTVVERMRQPRASARTVHASQHDHTATSRSDVMIV